MTRASTARRSSWWDSSLWSAITSRATRFDVTNTQLWRHKDISRAISCHFVIKTCFVFCYFLLFFPDKSTFIFTVIFLIKPKICARFLIIFYDVIRIVNGKFRLVSIRKTNNLFQLNLNNPFFYFSDTIKVTSVFILCPFFQLFLFPFYVLGILAIHKNVFFVFWGFLSFDNAVLFIFWKLIHDCNKKICK